MPSLGITGLVASKSRPDTDARRRLQDKLRQWPRQRHLERRAWVHLGRGMAVWSLLVLLAMCFMGADNRLLVGFTALFAPGPVFAWYSWCLARREVEGTAP